MSTTDIPHNALVVVADGEKALMLRVTSKPGEALKLEADAKLTPKNLLDEGATAKGGGRSEDDPKKEDEATFAKQLAEQLFALAGRGAYDALVLAADPTTLGEMRKTLHKTVTDRIVREVAKTLTTQPVDGIARTLSA